MTEGLLITFGSQNGTSQDYGEDMYLEATMKGIGRVRLMNLNDFYDLGREHGLEEQNIAVLISNTGDGDPPDNATRFWKGILDPENDNSFLDGKMLALLGFGDSNYTMFNNTGRTLAEKLPKLGVKWLLTPTFCDAEVGNDITVEPWLELLWDVIEGRKPSGVGLPSPKTMDQLSTQVTALEIKDAKGYKFWNFPTKPDLQEGDFDMSTLPKIHPITVTVTTEHQAGSSIFTDDFSEADLKAVHTASDFGGVGLKAMHGTDDFVEASHENPISGMDVQMFALTSPQAVKEVVSVQFTVDDKRWTCEAGDAFGIVCENDPEIVKSLLDLMGLDGEQIITVSPLTPISPESLLSFIANKPISLFDLFSKYADIMQFPKKAFLRGLAEYCSCESDRLNLLHLCSKAGSKDYMSLASNHANIMDFFSTFSSCRAPLDYLLSNMSLLHPRFYSVCSATGCKRVEFVYSSMEFSMPDGSVRKGVCSSWLGRRYLEAKESLDLKAKESLDLKAKESLDLEAKESLDLKTKESLNLKAKESLDLKAKESLDLEAKESLNLEAKESSELETKGSSNRKSLNLKADKFSVFPRPSPHFRLPIDPEIPIIMICAGTGISPFIGFLRSEKRLRNTMWLFFGFRHPEQDFLFKEELDGFLSKGILSRLTISTSRDPDSGHPRYVQDALRVHSLELYTLMEAKPGALMFICGDELTMIKDVNNCIQEMISEHAQLPSNEAQAIFNGWNKEKRIIRDVWV